jgi:hypothetical protein
LTSPPIDSPAAKLAEERALHEAKLAKMEAEMKMVFQQKVAEKEAKLKQSEEELYARHREMKESLERQRADLEDKKRRLESGRPLTPEGKGTVSFFPVIFSFFTLEGGAWLMRVCLIEEATWVPWWEIDGLRVRSLHLAHSIIPVLLFLGLRYSLCVYSSSNSVRPFLHST